MQTSGSRFVRLRRCVCKSCPSRCPAHIPRAMTVLLRGVHTRTTLPGDIVTVAGVFLPRPINAQRAASAMGLLADTFLEAQRVTLHKQRAHGKDDVRTICLLLRFLVLFMRVCVFVCLCVMFGVQYEDEEMSARIDALHSTPQLYDRLATSIAPEIFGHVDVKKALLLLLVAGATRTLPDGTQNTTFCCAPSLFSCASII